MGHEEILQGKDHIRLEPANGAMALIMVDPSRDTKVLGVLVRVMRKC
jgi:SOS-response transcriptional repressor LexA